MRDSRFTTYRTVEQHQACIMPWRFGIPLRRSYSDQRTSGMVKMSRKREPTKRRGPRRNPVRRYHRASQSHITSTELLIQHSLAQKRLMQKESPLMPLKKQRTARCRTSQKRTTMSKICLNGYHCRVIQRANGTERQNG